MLSKNNYQERLRKMERKQERFSIRKFSVGAASVLIGVLFFMNEGPTNHVVRASELTGHNVNVASEGTDSTGSEAKPVKTLQVASDAPTSSAEALQVASASTSQENQEAKSAAGENKKNNI